MNDEKDSGQELQRQIWEPAGVISVSPAAASGEPEYGEKPKDREKSGRWNLEMEELFHNKGFQENQKGSVIPPKQ